MTYCSECSFLLADLSNNRFDKVPKEINRFKAIVKLNCHHNSIRWLPEELNLLSNLKEIDIRYVCIGGGGGLRRCVHGEVL